jgi:hypothetical protein
MAAAFAATAMPDYGRRFIADWAQDNERRAAGQRAELQRHADFLVRLTKEQEERENGEARNVSLRAGERRTPESHRASFLRFWHRRMGVGQSCDVLHSFRGGSVHDAQRLHRRWNAGMGVDYAITNSVFGRIEYRYTNLNAPGFVSSAANCADGANRVPINDLRVGIAYEFSGGPVVAKF